MKKIFVIIAALLIAPVFAYSRTVSEGVAALYAARFFKGKEVKTTNSVKRVRTASTSETPAYYLFNSVDGGFVIISGEDSTVPVFGFDQSRTLDPAHMPPALEWWLGTYEDAVRRNRDAGVRQSPEIARKWVAVGEERDLTRAGGLKVSCLTPEWNQMEPWNCKLKYSTWPVGCVATAISEVMCYYGFPDKGTGEVGGYIDGNNNIFESYTLSTTYQWSELQKLKTEAEAQAASESVKENLGQLLLDIGMALQMTYDEAGSGTTFGIRAMGDHFYYNKGARILYRACYSHDEWFSMIKDQIDAGHPIPYSGQSNGDGGHQFVFDGYYPEEYECVHINWGWGGYGNGWFWLGSNFYGNQDMVVDFYPDESQTSSYGAGDIILQSYPAWLEYESFQPSGMIQKNKSFNLSAGVIWNTNVSDFNGYIKAAHLDKDGNFVEFISTAKSCSVPIGTGTSAYITSCMVKKNINFGDQIALYRSYSMDGTFEPMLAMGDGSSVATYPIRPLPFIDIKQSYSVGERVYLTLKNHDFAYLWSCYGHQTDSHYSIWDFYNGDELVASVSTEAEARFFEIPSAGQYTVVVRVVTFGSSSVDHVICASFVAN